MRVALEDIADSSAGRRLSRLEAAVVSTLLPARPFFLFSRLEKAAVLPEGEKAAASTCKGESQNAHTLERRQLAVPRMRMTQRH